MTTKIVTWFIAPGFTVRDVQRWAAYQGLRVPDQHAKISSRKRKGWRRVFVETRVTIRAVL